MIILIIIMMIRRSFVRQPSGKQSIQEELVRRSCTAALCCNHDDDDQDDDAWSWCIIMIITVMMMRMMARIAIILAPQFKLCCSPTQKTFILSFSLSQFQSVVLFLFQILFAKCNISYAVFVSATAAYFFAYHPTQTTRRLALRQISSSHFWEGGTYDSKIAKKR